MLGWDQHFGLSWAGFEKSDPCSTTSTLIWTNFVDQQSWADGEMSSADADAIGLAVELKDAVFTYLILLAQVFGCGWRKTQGDKADDVVYYDPLM